MMQKSPTRSQIISEFHKICSELEGEAHQTVAHHRKFLLACSQFRQFINIYKMQSDDQKITQKQYDAYKLVVKYAKEYQFLFGQNMIQCWSSFALENKSSTVASVRYGNKSERNHQGF